MSRQKKLVKSNKSKTFSWNAFLALLKKLFSSSKIDFWPFLKLQKMEFGQNIFSWNWFFGLDFFKFSGQLCNLTFNIFWYKIIFFCSILWIPIGLCYVKLPRVRYVQMSDVDYCPRLKFEELLWISTLFERKRGACKKKLLNSEKNIKTWHFFAHISQQSFV